MADLSVCSFILIISSWHMPWAHEDRQSKVKGSLLKKKKTHKTKQRLIYCILKSQIVFKIQIFHS